MNYDEIILLLQDTTNRWPMSSLFVACLPMIMAMMTLSGGHPW